MKFLKHFWTLYNIEKKNLNWISWLIFTVKLIFWTVMERNVRSIEQTKLTLQDRKRLPRVHLIVFFRCQVVPNKRLFFSSEFLFLFCHNLSWSFVTIYVFEFVAIKFFFSFVAIWVVIIWFFFSFLAIWVW